MTAERVFTILSGLFLFSAAVLLWWNNLTAAFVTATLGIVAWFLSFRAQMRARVAAESPIESHGDHTERARVSGRQSVAFVALLLISFTANCKRNGITAVPGGWPPSSSPSTSSVSSSLDVVRIKAESVATTVGQHADARVVLTISQGFHINANPATFPYLIATELEVGNGYGMVTAGKPVYPGAQTRRFKFAEEPLAVYEGDVRLIVPLRTTSKVTRGSISLPISVTVQACDEEKCFPPGTLNTMIPIEVK
jgi:hypothetical protein